MHIALAEGLYFARGFAIALMLFAMIPLLYADCPQEMCCPVDVNCQDNAALCKPIASSPENCQEAGNVFTFSHSQRSTNACT